MTTTYKPTCERMLDPESDLSPSVRRRMAQEFWVMHKVITAILAAGYTVTLDYLVDDGDTRQFDKWEDIKPHLQACDQEILLVFKDGRHYSSVELTYGNDGYDVVSDYGQRMFSIIDPIVENIEEDVLNAAFAGLRTP